LLYCFGAAEVGWEFRRGGEAMKASLIAAMLGAVMVLTGCIETDIDISKTSKTKYIEGNELLSLVKTKLFGDLIEPIMVKRDSRASQLASARISSLTIEVTEDSLDGEGDEDDLLFVESVRVFIMPRDEDSDLPRRLIGWYEKEEADLEDPMVLSFQVNGDVDLLPYFEEGLQLVFDAVAFVPSDDVSIKAHADFVGVYEVL